MSEYHIHSRLLCNPATLDIPVAFGVGELNIIISANLQRKFVYLEERNVLTNADSKACTKIQQEIDLLAVVRIAVWLATVILTVNRFFLISLNCSGSDSIQRSGRKQSASFSNITLFRWSTHALMPITVPPGRWIPDIASPPAGTWRSRIRPTGGWIRKASVMTAELFC